MMTDEVPPEAGGPMSCPTLEEQAARLTLPEASAQLRLRISEIESPGARRRLLVLLDRITEGGAR